jgi:hypothetical protein
MANSLSEELTGRYVVLKEEALAVAYRAIEYRVFKVEGGFGAAPYTRGTAVIGFSPFDGEKWRTDGHDIERFATDEEIALATPKEPADG